MNANYPANHQESRPDRDWTRLDGDPVSSAILVDALTSSSKPGGPSADGGEDCTDSDTRICTREPRANDPNIPGFVEASQGGMGGGFKEELGDCVKSLFQPYFPEYVVDGRGVNIANDARFISGFNSPIARIVKKANPDASAVTLGLYEIHYNSEKISLSSPTWDALGTLAEELAHGEQFIKMWQNMPDVPYLVNNPNNPRAPITRTRRPNDSEAFTQWGIDYLAASASAKLDGKDSYWGNQYEIDAQKRRDQIMDDLRQKHQQEYSKGERICP